MFRKSSLAIIIALLLALFAIAPVHAQGTAFTYQGELTSSGSPVTDTCDFQFRVYDGAGTPVSTLLTLNAVDVTDGRFNVQLDFGTGIFTGADRFLQINVKCPPDTTFTPLIPRQLLTPSPYSIYAGGAASVDWSGLTSIPTGLSDGDDVGNDWTLAGNAGTAPGTNFLGTTDNAALELHVNGTRALLIELNSTSPNIIGGHSANSGSWAGTFIGGGGTASSPNSVSADYGTIGGGAGNTTIELYSTVSGGRDNMAGKYEPLDCDGCGATVGGGWNNSAVAGRATVSGGEGNTSGAMYATVGGGINNTVDGFAATVSGGGENIVSGDRSTVGGGFLNSVTATYGTIAGGGPSDVFNPETTANRVTDDYGTIGGGGNNQAGDTDGNATTGAYATVAGGRANTASGGNSTVGGGYNNIAGGDYSFAVGWGANNDAAHDGVFLFADSTGEGLSSIAANEFAVRATGGARFLTAAGTTTGATLAAGSGSWSSLSDVNAKNNFEAVDGRAVLEAVTRMDIATWNYRTQDDSIRHMGPVAQDFSAAFGIGENDTTISTVDADGVSLAAIQGLYEMMQEKDAQIAELQAQVSGSGASQADLQKMRFIIIVMAALMLAGMGGMTAVVLKVSRRAMPA